MWLSRLLIAATLALATACSGLAVKPLGSSLSQQDLGVAVVNTDGRKGQIYTRNLTRLLGDTTTPKFQLVSALSSCLLYTSPSPRDRTRSRMPSSA